MFGEVPIQKVNPFFFFSQTFKTPKGIWHYFECPSPGCGFYLGICTLCFSKWVSIIQSQGLFQSFECNGRLSIATFQIIHFPNVFVYPCGDVPLPISFYLTIHMCYSSEFKLKTTSTRYFLFFPSKKIALNPALLELLVLL